MYSDHELCKKITDMYPDIGACGINVDVKHDEQEKTWTIDLKKEGHELKHHLEYPDADSCMEGNYCVSLGLEIAQLRKNIEGQQY